MNAAPALPTLREELDRKVWESISWLITGVTKGRLTEEQFSTGLDALFMAVAGLTNEEFIHLITDAQDECKAVKAGVRRHFAMDDHTITLSWTVGEDRVVVSKKQGGFAVGGSVKDFDDAAAAKAWLAEFADKLELKGYMEL